MALDTVESAIDKKAAQEVVACVEYRVGVDDVIEVVILQPEKIAVTATVSPDGYMKYPVVVVTLKESRSKKFFVYGEVMKPGTYYLDENATVLKAISMAGGFTKYGSSSRVKVLRPKKDSPGYEAIKVNIKAVMDGASTDDVVLEPNDIIVVSEGIF